jgi:hypothetical protein
MLIKSGLAGGQGLGDWLAMDHAFGHLLTIKQALTSPQGAPNDRARDTTF